MTLDTLEKHAISLQNFPAKWLFTDKDECLPSVEHQEQIILLSIEAANFLWDMERKLGVDTVAQWFLKISTHDSSASDEKQLKKYLYSLGIPFSQKVFMAIQPDTAMILTWKMVIKYSDRLFHANDQTVWDRSMNWKLTYHHDGLFTFGEGLRREPVFDLLHGKKH